MIGQGMDEIACIVEDQPPGKKEPTGERIEREGIMNPNNNPAAARMMLANGKIVSSMAADVMLGNA